MLTWLNRCASAFGVAVLLASAASAHPMLLLGAEMTLAGGDLRIEFSASDADLEHLGIDPMSDGARAALASLIGASIVATDDRGDRIALQTDGGGGALAGTIGVGATAIALRIEPDSPLATRGGQAQIRTTLRETPLRLARGGNVEVVRLGRVPTPTEPGEAWLWRERFAGVAALVSREGDAMVVDVVAPLAVVETWRTIPRSGRETIDPADADASLRAFGATLLRAVVLGDADGLFAGRVEHAALLGPASVRDDAVSGPIGASSACVWVRLRYKVGSAERPLMLTWGAFNAAVHRARVFMPGAIDAVVSRDAPAVAVRSVE